MAELALQTPAQIDLQWEPLASKLDKILSRLASYRAGIRKFAAGDGSYTGYQRYYDDYKAQTATEVAGLKAAIEPLQAEWERRRGWQRYFLCVSDGGHVHYRQCRTLRPNSMLAWMPTLSGLDESGMVEHVGWKACTVCFSSAPLHPAWARSEAEYQRKTADEKLAKWTKGYEARTKKVVNIGKRIEKAKARLAAAEAAIASGSLNGVGYEKSSAESDLEWNAKDLIWAEREVARWEAKKP